MLGLRMIMNILKIVEFEEVKVKDHDHMITTPEYIEDPRIKNVIYI